ncbi:hypothetical protein HY837_04620 [archaeon]|nr:hypothetical protein [archaeon]
MYKKIVFLFFLILISGCSEKKIIVNENSTIFIELHSFNSFSGLGSSRVISNNGTITIVEFRVIGGLKKNNTERYQISRKDVLNLAQFMIDKGFFSKTFNPGYEDCLDCTRQTITVSIDNLTKTLNVEGASRTNKDSLTQILYQIQNISKKLK